MKEKKTSTELKAKFGEDEVMRFRACVCAREMATGEKLTHQAAIKEAIMGWMDHAEEKYGRVMIEVRTRAKGKHG